MIQEDILLMYHSREKKAGTLVTFETMPSQ